jgi:hypothetical protein
MFVSAVLPALLCAQVLVSVDESGVRAPRAGDGPCDAGDCRCFLAIGSPASAGGILRVRSGGRLVKVVTLPSDAKTADPILVDLSCRLSRGLHPVSLSAGGMGAMLVRLIASHWLPWGQTAPRTNPGLRFTVPFDRLEGNAGEPVRCTVRAERVGFRGHDMMLAEIGLPPGAEVDRAPLETVLDGRARLDYYKIPPDRVALYLWPSAGGSTFELILGLRNRMDAQPVYRSCRITIIPRLPASR